MSAKFWQAHSIKQQPVVDSLVKTLRAGRVDVSGMSTEQLHGHMTREAELVRGIRRAKGLPEVMGTRPPEVVATPVIPQQPADVLPKVKRGPHS
jgi:hypothetical protein